MKLPRFYFKKENSVNQKEVAEYCWDNFVQKIKPYLLTKQEEETYVGVPSPARLVDLLDLYREIMGEIASLHRRMNSLCLANNKVIREIRSRKRKFNRKGKRRKK